MTEETHQILLMMNNLIGLLMIFWGVDWYVLNVME